VKGEVDDIIGSDITRRGESDAEDEVPSAGNYVAGNYVAGNYVAETCDDAGPQSMAAESDPSSPDAIRRRWSRARSAEPCGRFRTQSVDPLHHQARSSSHTLYIHVCFLLIPFFLLCVVIPFSHAEYFIYLYYILYYVIYFILFFIIICTA